MVEHLVAAPTEDRAVERDPRTELEEVVRNLTGSGLLAAGCGASLRVAG